MLYVDVLASPAESGVLQRQCCGAGREFSMAITDNTHREVSTHWGMCVLESRHQK